MNKEEAVSRPYDISNDYRNIVILSPDKELSQFSDFLDSPARSITKGIRAKKWPGRQADCHSEVGTEGNLRDVWYSEVNEPILSAWFNKDRTPLTKVYRLRPRGREVSWEAGQSDRSNSSHPPIRKTEASLLRNSPPGIQGTSMEDADEKHNTPSTENCRFEKDRTPLTKVYRLRPRGRQVYWEVGQSDTSDSSNQPIRETESSLLRNSTQGIRGNLVEDADEKHDTSSTKNSPISLLGNPAKSKRPSHNDEEYSQSTFDNWEVKSLSSDDIDSSIIMLEASDDSTAPPCVNSQDSEIDEQVSKMTLQINYLVSRLNAIEEKLAGQSTTKPTFEDSILEFGSMISGLKNEMADRDAKFIKLWKKGSKVEQTTIARKHFASKLRKYKRGKKKTRKKAMSSKKFWKKKDLENEDFGSSDTDTQSLGNEAQISLMSNHLSSISKLTENPGQKKTDKQSNDQSEISCLGPLLDDQELGDTILPMPSKLGSSLQMNMDEGLPKKYVPHSPSLYPGKTQDNCTDELRQEIVKILRSRNDIPNQRRAPLPTDDFSQSKQNVTPNCSGMSTDPDESSDEGASTIGTQQTTSRLLTDSGSSKPSITHNLKRSEPEIKISVVSTKSTIDSETTSDPYPAYLSDFTVIDSKSKNLKKKYVDRSDLVYQKSTANEQLYNACKYSVYDLEKRRKADNLYKSSRSTRGYLKRESSESPGLHRRWSPATDTNMNKRKGKFHRECSINTTIATLNNIENCLFGKEQRYIEQSQLSSKPHHLNPSVSRETLLRPSNVLRGGCCRTYCDNNYKKILRK